MKILIVDDTLVMRKMQRNALNQMGLTDIIEARNGIDAIGKLESDPTINLVLLDWNMPAMNGITVLKSIKSSENTKKIPVIMVTAENNKSNVLDAVKSGASGYIMIPFTAKDYKAKVQSVIEKTPCIA